MSVADEMREALGAPGAAGGFTGLDPLSPEAAVEALGALEKPADLDRVADVLRRLVAGLARADRLAVVTAKAKTMDALERLEVKSARSFVSAAFDRLEPSQQKGRRTGSGGVLDFPDPEPWPDSVSGADLLSELRATFGRYLALPQGCAVALALWTCHTWTLDAGPISPRLGIVSPEKRCGKSTLLRILERLVARPLNVSNMTAAAVFRTVEACRPTLLVDEADTFLAGSDELRGILNSGHERSGRVVRTVGDDHEPRAFGTFSAVALAAIGKLPETLEDRAVVVKMRRKAKGERVARFRSDRTPDLDELARKLFRWATDSLPLLSAADPDVPAALHDRAADNWRPLLAVADLSGQDWPGIAREVALLLSEAGDPSDAGSLRELLLSDIRTILEGRDAISSADLCAELVKLDDRPWPEASRGKPLNPHRLRKLLRPFDVRSRGVRIGGATPKGYRQADFADAFARYLPDLAAEGDATSQQRNNASGARVCGDSDIATGGGRCEVDNGLKPNAGAGCCDVAKFKPRNPPERESPVAEPLDLAAGAEGDLL